MSKDQEDEGILAESLLAGNPDSPNYLHGVVQLSWNKDRGQVDIPTARKLAIRILDAAQAAETDELYVRWLMTKANLPIEAAVAALQDIRAMREDWLR